MTFVHLHCHSEYSLLDGANRIDALIDRAVELGMPALALTDHGNLHGAWAFQAKARKKGLEPIIGCEAYVAYGDRRGRQRPPDAPAEYAHLVLLARNLQGYRNLVRLSSRGFAYGYIGGGLALLLVFGMIQGHSFLGFADKGAASRAGFLLTGLWWLLFALPTYLYVRTVASPILPDSLHRGIRGYLRIFAEIRKYPALLLFLIAFLFYNDGIQTIIVVAAIFAREELGLSQSTILSCFLMIQFVAMPGTLLFGRLAEEFGAKRSIYLALFLFILVTIYAYFMNKAWEFWLLGFIIAIILGGSQAVSRSFFQA